MSRFYAIAFTVLIIAGCEQRTSKEYTAAHETSNETEKNIYKSGDSMLAAFKRKDWLTFVKYNQPNMTKRMGGPEAFASFINTQMKQIPDTAIKSLRLGKILQVVQTPTDEQCVVEQNMAMALEGNQIDKKTYLVGESLDKGKTWTFFDASTKTTLLPKDIKPDLSPQLKIPDSKNIQ